MKISISMSSTNFRGGMLPTSRISPRLVPLASHSNISVWSLQGCGLYVDGTVASPMCVKGCGGPGGKPKTQCVFDSSAFGSFSYKHVGIGVGGVPGKSSVLAGFTQ